MRINRLKLIDWRNHAETDLTFDRLTCIRGANHSGKSSIAQAIEFALTGHCDATDAKGTGAAGLIRQGADKAVVLMKLQANKEIDYRCSITEKSGRSVTIRDEHDPAWTGEAVKGWIDSQRAVLSCVLNSRYFLGLKPAEQKALLSSIILPDSYIWPENIQSLAKRVHLAIEWNQAPFDVIESAYKLAFEKRRDINRDVKSLHIPEPLSSDGQETLSAIREKLADLRAKREAIEKRYRESTAEQSAAQGKITALEQRVQSLEAKGRMEQQALSQAESGILSPKQLKDFKKTAGNAERLAQLEADRTRIGQEIAGIESVLSMFDDLGEKTECPMCQRAVTEQWLIDAMTPHKDKLDKAYASQRDLMVAMKQLGDVAGAKAKLEEHERAQASKERSQSIMADTDRLLRAAREELQAARDSYIGMPVEPVELDDLRQQIAELEESQSKAAVVEARQKEIERAQEQHHKLTEAASALNTLVEYFGPNGVKAEMLAEHIGGFTASMNAALSEWGYEAAFEIEPYGFRVTNLETQATLPLELLSGSERLRFAVAFQVALAQVSGIRMVVVDEADMLDGEGRMVFYPMLLNADLDQAIAIGTNEEEDAPEVEGAVFYAMHGGRAHRLEAAVAAEA